MRELIIAALLISSSALARDNGQWSAVPDSVYLWFRDLTQPDNPAASCCGEADAFEADTFESVGGHYVAVITNGRGVVPDGTRVAIPDGKIKFDAGNPTGHGIVFLGSSGQVYCYVTPSGI